MVPYLTTTVSVIIGISIVLDVKLFTFSEVLNKSKVLLLNLPCRPVSL